MPRHREPIVQVIPQAGDEITFLFPHPALVPARRVRATVIHTASNAEGKAGSSCTPVGHSHRPRRVSCCPFPSGAGEPAYSEPANTAASITRLRLRGRRSTRTRSNRAGRTVRNVVCRFHTGLRPLLATKAEVIPHPEQTSTERIVSMHSATPTEANCQSGALPLSLPGHWPAEGRTTPTALAQGKPCHNGAD